MLNSRIVAAFLMFAASSLHAAILLTQNFDNIATLAGSGWVLTNNSNVAGSTGWFQGNTSVFDSQAGAANAYIGANFNNAAFGGNISNWLITPTLALTPSTVLTFFTRTETAPAAGDRIDVRLSTNGASTNVGASDSSVGDFTTVLATVNSTQVVGGYPTGWTQFSVNLSVLGGPANGRLAIRYFVSDTSKNGDYIGIDSLSIATLDPPVVTKSFTPNVALVNGASTLNITITNPNPIPLTNLNLADALPPGMIFGAAAGAGGCGLNTVGTAGNIVSVSNGTIAANGACTIQMAVIGVQAGVWNNVTSTATTTEASPGAAASATLTVVESTSYQVGYASNLMAGNSFVNLTNTGTVNGFDPAGRICVNVYAFDPSEELVSCCTCPVTPDGLKSLSVKDDLLSNTLTPGVPGSVAIKLIASAPAAGVCNASTPTLATTVGGLRAWGTSLHQNTANGGYQLTENVFQSSVLSDSELMKLTTYCGLIQANGSGFGICKSCRVGGLGGAQQ